MNFKPNEKPEEASQSDSLDDEPIPTYEEYLDTLAKEWSETPLVLLLKSAIEFVRYLHTREALFINMLVAKDVLAREEVEEFFGPDVHKAAQDRGFKSLTAQLLRAASDGKMVGPDGKQMVPDDVLIVLNDILDLDNTGWSGKTIETIAEFRGEGENIRAGYDKVVSDIQTINGLRALRRKKRKEDAELERRARDVRERSVQIYLSKCVVANKPLPSEEEKQQMIEGTRPIPVNP